MWSLPVDAVGTDMLRLHSGSFDIDTALLLSPFAFLAKLRRLKLTSDLFTKYDKYLVSVSNESRDSVYGSLVGY